MRFGFAEFELDTDTRELSGPEGPIPVEPQVFEVLRYLMVHRHRVVPKTELLDKVWTDRFVSESTLTSRIKAARRAIDDDGRRQRFIETAHGVGYRFHTDVSVTLPTASVAPRYALPTLRTPLIGRDADMASLGALIARARLTSVVGPGGVGKTTLALAAAHLLQASRADGAVFIDLTPARTAADLTRIVASATGVEGEVGRTLEALATALGARSLLIVLDNCEHLLVPTAAFVNHLLSTSPTAQVLTTSREPLGLPDEHVLPLEPLGDAAVDLFVARARQVEPRVPWDPSDPAIVALCRRLDGLPLALELAAGQLRRWDLAELSAYVDRQCGPLVAPARRDSQRHQTMESAIDWSYQLLDRFEQRLLRHLAVFPAWFSLEAVRALSAFLPGGALERTLGDLVDKSLVVRDPAHRRYRLLETIRVFARTRLEETDEAAAALECHRAHVAARAKRSTRLDRWCSARLGAQQRADVDDARQAFWRSVTGHHVEDAVDIAVAFSFLWRNAIGCVEAAAWLDALAGCALDARDRAWTEVLRTDVGQGVGDFRAMIGAAQRALAVPADADPAAHAIASHYAALATLTDRHRAAGALAAVKALAIEERLVTLVGAFEIVADLHEPDRADLPRRLDELHRRASDDGYDRFILNWAAWLHGLRRQHAGDTQRWMTRQQEFLEHTGVIETWLTTFSTALTTSVDGRDVRSELARTRAIADREGYRIDGDCLLALAYSEVRRGHAHAAAELLGVATTQRFNTTAHYVLYQLVIEPVIRQALPTDECETAMRHGKDRLADAVLAAYGVGP